LLLREPKLGSPSAHICGDRPKLSLDFRVRHPRVDTLVALAETRAKLACLEALPRTASHPRDERLA
jgi:hypothetical protein